MNDILRRDEVESDPQPPIELFTSEALEQALEGSKLATLKQLGLECPQHTPNFSSIDELLKRFNYWTDDVEQEDPFSPT